MKYGIKYQIQFKNQERDNVSKSFVGQTVDIGIYDTSSLIDPSAITQVYQLNPAGDPLHISSVDNSEDKFTPIRAIQAVMRFNSDENFGLATFTDAAVIGTDPGDPRWYVEILCNSKFIFKGWLVLDDCSETFMPDPNVVSLTATDGLGWLKNIPLVANNFKTINRGFTGVDGTFNVNVLTLNGFTQLFLPIRDLNHNTIQWVVDLLPGDQVQLTVKSDTTHTAIYTIVSIGIITAFNITFNVTNVSGDNYNMTPTEPYYIRKVGDPFVPMSYNRIADYLAWCLQKTGLLLNLRVVFNIRDYTSKQFSTSTQFNSGVNQFSVPVGYNNFYVGEIVTISGTASNNGNKTITAIIDLGFLGTLVQTAEAQVNETATATFQDTKYHFFDKEYLDARTFEDAIGTCINCYDVILKILGESAFLTQRSGEWWILRPDEIIDAVHYTLATFYADGTFLSIDPDATAYGQYIEKDTQQIFFSEERTEYSQSSQHKFIKETYKFEYPKETPCNSDFSRGAFIANLSNENDENGNSCTVKSYALDCWTMKRGFPLHSPISNDATDYIKRLFNSTDQEVQRYVVVTYPSANDVNQPYIESEGIPISAKDKFTISVDYRFPTSITSGSGYYKVMYIVLAGDDGSYWIYGTDEPGNSSKPIWYDTSGFTVLTQRGEKGFDWATTESGVDWATQTFNCDPAPVSGSVFIWLHGMNFNAASYDNINIYYTNLQFTYFPYINGSYSKYSDIYAKVSRNINFRANRDKEVFISDGIKKLFKGALFIKSGTGFMLSVHFFDYPKYHSPTDAQIHPFLFIQAFDVWNQYRNVMKIFRANAQGLCSNIVGSDGELYYPSLIHTWFLQDGHASTFNKRFLLLTFDQNWFTCEWTGTLAEVYKVDVPKADQTIDTIEIKYE